MDEGLARFRMLNACGCGRQYDVSHLSPGAKVSCACGSSFTVEFRQPHSPRALQCSSCGANLKVDAKSCEFCNAQITLEERRLDSVCPHCFSRMARDARYCMECGTEIVLQELTALPAGTVCPRCSSALRARTLGKANVTECSACGGLWLKREHFERVTDDADARDLAARALATSDEPHVAVPELPIRYLPCVICRDMMLRRNFGSSSGVIIDVCQKHGVWLDHSELEKILQYIKRGGLDRQREKQLQRLKEEQRKARQHTGPVMGGRGFDLDRRGGLDSFWGGLIVMDVLGDVLGGLFD